MLQHRYVTGHISTLEVCCMHEGKITVTMPYLDAEFWI